MRCNGAERQCPDRAGVDQRSPWGRFFFFRRRLGNRRNRIPTEPRASATGDKARREHEATGPPTGRHSRIQYGKKRSMRPFLWNMGPGLFLTCFTSSPPPDPGNTYPILVGPLHARIKRKSTRPSSRSIAGAAQCPRGGGKTPPPTRGCICTKPRGIRCTAIELYVEQRGLRIERDLLAVGLAVGTREAKCGRSGHRGRRRIERAVAGSLEGRAVCDLRPVQRLDLDR